MCKPCNNANNKSGIILANSDVTLGWGIPTPRAVYPSSSDIFNH